LPGGHDHSRVYERLAVAGGELAGAVRRAGGEVVGPEAADAAVAVGDSALSSLAGEGLPVLAVDVDGVPSVPSEALEDALAALVDGTVEESERPLLGVEGADTDARGLFDVALFAAEPGRISEFRLDDGGDPLDTVRADGVVVATPAGSHGYARAAGGPTLAPDAGAVAVVPVAAFGSRADRWVAAPEIGVSVQRDEVPVELAVDGRPAGPVPANRRLSVDSAGALRLLRPATDGLEKL